MTPDEYHLDSPVVRQFIARVRALIGNAASPEEACEAIKRPFAALLALSGDTDVSCQYVGPVPTAKGYGTFPLYTLRGPGSRTDV